MRSTSILRLCGAVLTTLALMASIVPQQASAISSGGILASINAQRSNAGLQALKANSLLNTSAYAKAQDMCSKDYWAHTSPDGLTGWTFIGRAGYPYISAAENLAEGYSSDSAVVSAWMASPGHRTNIMNGGFQDFGAASVTCNFMGKQSTVVVGHFGSQSVKQPTQAPVQQTKPVVKAAPQQTYQKKPQPVKTTQTFETAPKQLKPVKKTVKKAKRTSKNPVVRQVMGDKQELVTLLLSRLQSPNTPLFSVDK